MTQLIAALVDHVYPSAETAADTFDAFNGGELAPLQVKTEENMPVEKKVTKELAVAVEEDEHQAGLD